jgi:UrcA family protein
MLARASSLRALIIAVIGCVAAGGWPAVGRAQQAPTVRSIRLYIGDLRPDRATDAATLYARIRIAAEATCGEPQLPESHFIDPDYPRCVEAAIREAVTQVDSAALSAYYQRRISRERRS